MSTTTPSTAMDRPTTTMRTARLPTRAPADCCFGVTRAAGERVGADGAVGTRSVVMDVALGIASGRGVGSSIVGAPTEGDGPGGVAVFVAAPSPTVTAAARDHGEGPASWCS